MMDTTIECDCCEGDEKQPAEFHIPSATSPGEIIHMCWECMEAVFRKVVSEPEFIEHQVH